MSKEVEIEMENPVLVLFPTWDSLGAKDFEKPTKYFLGLEKAHHKVKHIRNLNYEGKSYTIPAEILQIQHDYFSKIYTEKYNGSFDTDIDKYLNEIDIPQISD